MAKNLFKGMAALCICAAFASCSKDAGFETASSPAELAKIQYKEAFIKKYGPIDPNQSWDFTGHSFKVTRAEVQPSLKWEQKGYGGTENTNYLKTLKADGNEVMEKAVSESAQAFPYTYSSMYLRPAFAHGYKANYNYYHLGAEYTNNGVTTPCKEVITVNAKWDEKRNKDVWYVQGGSTIVSTCNNLNFGTYRIINTMNCLNADDAQWWVYTEAAQSNDGTTKKKVELCKMFTVKSGRKYICFDCDGDGNYTDLICQYTLFDYTEKEEPQPKVWAKRYMVEDLGAATNSDFDFNDIVFDVIQDVNGKQHCYIRALGGTIDVIITVGSTSWQKSNNTVEPTIEVTKMYNTLDPDYNLVIDDFEVTGWNPEESSAVSVTVYCNDQYGNLYTNKIDFPKTGDVPMMVAVNPSKNWMKEYVSINSVPDDFVNVNDFNDYNP